MSLKCEVPPSGRTGMLFVVIHKNEASSPDGHASTGAHDSGLTAASLDKYTRPHVDLVKERVDLSGGNNAYYP